MVSNFVFVLWIGGAFLFLWVPEKFLLDSGHFVYWGALTLNSKFFPQGLLVLWLRPHVFCLFTDFKNDLWKDNFHRRVQSQSSLQTTFWKAGRRFDEYFLKRLNPVRREKKMCCISLQRYNRDSTEARKADSAQWACHSGQLSCWPLREPSGVSKHTSLIWEDGVLLAHPGTWKPLARMWFVWCWAGGCGNVASIQQAELYLCLSWSPPLETVINLTPELRNSWFWCFFPAE